ncbi:MAG: glycosyltransferase family 2 protein [Bacteroides sp.]|nr:glycosyltransferase family 2 protein [Bacteroides sp.]MCM1390168.1 glycosyltransferase family 2 protein [Bacteroides sp.]
MILDVLISTIYVDGIERVARMNLPEIDGVRYIVSWQMPGKAEVPASLKRHDISVFPHESKGLSVNRNYALSKAEGDICLVADDDLIYTPQMLRCVTAAFERNPGIDLALFKIESPDGKRYADHEYDLSRAPRYFYVTEVEMAFRRESVKGKIFFSPKIGLGSDTGEVLAGEGEMFYFTAMKKGLKCRFFPEVIAIHEGVTTGACKNLSAGVERSKGVFIYMKHRHSWLPRIIVNALREHKHGRCRVDKALLYLWQGVAFARRNFNADGTDR